MVNTPPRGELRWERAAAILICVGAAALCLHLFFRYLLGALMPFLIAYLLSCLLRPILDRMTGRPQPGQPSRGRRLLSALLVLLLTAGACRLAVAGVKRGVAELESLLLRLGESLGEGEAGVSQALDYIWSLSEHLPFLRRFEATPGFAGFCRWLDEAVRAAAESLAGRLSSLLSAGAVSLVSGLPSALLFAAVLLMSCYYFTAEPGLLTAKLCAHLPPAWEERLTAWQTGVGQSLRRYLRACLLMAGLTFLEMFIGLSLLRKPYALLLALLIAFVDLLPVLGTGTVLIPWGAAELLLGRTASGLGLLALYAASLILREVLEPHLIGRSLGLHPLLSLLATYIGFSLFGIPGMLLLPVALGQCCGQECRKTAKKCRKNVDKKGKI